MDGLWKMAPELRVVMSKDGQRTYSCAPNRNRGLMVEFKFKPFTDLVAGNDSIYLAPLTLVEWSD